MLTTEFLKTSTSNPKTTPNPGRHPHNTGVLDAFAGTNLTSKAVAEYSRFVILDQICRAKMSEHRKLKLRAADTANANIMKYGALCRTWDLLAITSIKSSHRASDGRQRSHLALSRRCSRLNRCRFDAAMGYKALSACTTTSVLTTSANSSFKLAKLTW